MQYSILKFKRNDKHTLRDLEKLRGFLSEKYNENILFHKREMFIIQREMFYYSFNCANGSS